MKGRSALKAELMVRGGCWLIPTETQGAKLQLLTQWLSPAFPLGAFSYSHGLEWAVKAKDVVDEVTLKEWISANIIHGAGRNDAIFIAHAYRAEEKTQLHEIEQLAKAFASSKERLQESTSLGKAFVRTLADVWGDEIEASSYSVVLGAAAKIHKLDLSLAMTMFLQSFGANLVACGQRLLPVGQKEGQKIITDFAPQIDSLVPEAINASLDELGGCVFRSDMASMKHEDQKVRIFRT
ncbi:MAG: urease accessory protein UreF [Devosiaceae bacterium]|nr:urease accessory protein UreF [Devosiaceae bacterium]